MSIYLSGEPRLDTRGLPVGFDPHKFYEYRYDTLVKDATGLESFLLKYIPYSIIRSFAFAIDPTAPFKVAPGVITPANRTRYRATASVLNQRYLSKTKTQWARTQPPNWRNVQVCWGPIVPFSSTTKTQSSLTTQAVLSDYCKDTTRRTRLYGSSQGELEFFKHYIESPARTIYTYDDIYKYFTGTTGPSCAAVGGSYEKEFSSGTRLYQSIYPTAATLSVGTYNALRSQEIAFNRTLVQKNAVSMLKGWSPFRREYTLFRNLVELRDIPRGVLQLQNTLRDLRSLFVSLGTNPELRRSVFDLRRTASNIPSEYLSFHFGWKQTYKDLMDLLVTPAKISKKVNFLIERNGKPTTFRVGRTIPSNLADVSGFGYETVFEDYNVSVKSRLERISELRLVVNATFDFPPINSPSFRSKSFIDRIGIVPRPTDLYNLVPWTWLVDWFTGLGNYVELIDDMNHDPSLVNWGLITCSTKGKLITNFQSRSPSRSRISVDGVGSDVTTWNTNNHTSTLHYECQTRSDVATVLGVKTTSNPSSLTTYQKSILGALLAQRNQRLRDGSFRPIS